MIAIEPNLRKVLETVVFGDLPRREVAVEIDDRQIAGEIVVQPHGGFVLEQKVLGDEVRHRATAV